MSIKIGLMGFGRMGRHLLRRLHARNDIQIVVASDIADHASLHYLTQYDTILGRFPERVTLQENTLHAGTQRITMLSGKEPGSVPWSDYGVDIVIEATSKYTNRVDLEKHLQAGAKRVLLCSPATDAPDITVVMGVNHTLLRPEHQIIATSSVTAHCAAPIVQILHQAFDLERLFFTTVHAYSNDQRLADVPADDLRRSRAATENIIPNDTNAAQLLEQLIPSLAGKITGMALKVPVINGSMVDMVGYTSKPISSQAINDAVRVASENTYRGIVEYTQDPIVSSDVRQSSYSSTFDAAATMALSNHAFKAIAWFDNSWGYACRLLDLITYASTSRRTT